MTVRITESRIPGGFANAEALGEVQRTSRSADGNYVLVSYLTAPLRSHPVLLPLKNRYVVFVNTANVAAPAEYKWLFEFFGDDSIDPIPINPPTCTTTDRVCRLDVGQIPELSGVSINRVIVTVTIDGVADPLVIDQTVMGLYADIEELITSEAPESIARGGNPPVTRAIANRYRSYITASESEDPLTGVPPNLVAAITYLMAMASTDDLRALQEEEWENYIEGGGNATTVPEMPLGVTQLRPHIVSMFLNGQGGSPGVTPPDAWAADYEAYSVFQSRISQAFHLLAPSPTAPTERCDYINLLRFPKSALKVTRVLLDTLLAQHKEWASLSRTKLVENREAMEILASECEVGPFAGNTELTPVGRAVFNILFSPYIRGVVRMGVYVSIGNYEIRNAGNAGNAVVAQWPLIPGTTLARAVSNQSEENNFGLVDIALEVPSGATLNRTSVTNTGLTPEPAATSVNSATIFAEADLDVTQLTFLVDVGHETDPFEGTLHLEIHTSAGTRSVVIPLQVRPHESEDSLYIPLSLVQQLSDCTWIQLQALSAVDGTTVEGATAQIQFLRDNYNYSDTNNQNHNARIRDFNRYYPARTVMGGQLSGNVEGIISSRPRTTIGVPINWPVLFDVRADTFINCVKMLQFSEDQRTGHHNNHPHEPSAISLQPAGTRSLAGRLFVIDPGHGVVYDTDDNNDRRCYEWFLAHRIGARIHELLVNEHGVAKADITHMRTAGLALIHPNLFAVPGTNLTTALQTDRPPQDAPEQGDRDFEYDMTNRDVRIRREHDDNGNELTLTHISNLLLTTHDEAPPFSAQPVPDQDREEILTSNIGAIATRIASIMEGVAGRTAVPYSERWDPQSQHYVFDSVPIGNPAGMLNTHIITITTTDRWIVSGNALRRLAERTARWSLLREGPNREFMNVVRTEMLAKGALNYMADAIINEIDRTPPDVFLNYGIKGWSFLRRRIVMKALNPAPDITLTLHHNAHPDDNSHERRGMLMLASNVASATAAHLRLQKTFIKYVTGLGKGLGVHNNYAHRGITNTHSSALNNPAPTALISGYAFFENEFMNTRSGDPNLQFEYERMVQPEFIERTAQEIVAGIIDFLVNPQPNAEFDPIEIGAEINVDGVEW